MFGCSKYTLSNQRPADLGVNDVNRRAVQLTQLNHNLFAHKTLAKVEAMTGKSSFDIKILKLGLPYRQILTKAKGYVVVWANPRGSTSYGENVANLIHHNYPSQSITT